MNSTQLTVEGTVVCTVQELPHSYYTCSSVSGTLLIFHEIRIVSASGKSRDPLNDLMSCHASGKCR